jgi:hypothetical protein
MVNTVALLWVIRGREMEGTSKSVSKKDVVLTRYHLPAVLIEIGSPPKVTNPTTAHLTCHDGSDTEAQAVLATPHTLASTTNANQPVPQGSYKQILSLKAVHLMAFYALVYVGVEVTIGG